MKMQAFHLKSNAATQELKSLDRFWHQQWSMLFNSMTHEKSYHNLNISNYILFILHKQWKIIIIWDYD